MILNQQTEMVSKKIDQLFRTRRLAEHCEQVHVYNATTLLQKLKELQFTIYDLDKHFEYNWHLNDEAIHSCWMQILQRLYEITHGQQNLEELVSDIRKYQRFEEAIRNPFDFSLPSVSQYYYLKTCDVRLARRLITLQKGSSLSLTAEYLQSWQLFDLISEVCDDLEDIHEDILTFNGNRFLLGIGLFGAEVTIKELEFNMEVQL